jgi:hypothetical protein
MTGSSVAIIGVGDLGGWVLEFLARSRGVAKILVCDLNETWGKAKVNCALIGAAFFDRYPEITFEKMDLHHIEQSAEILSRFNPDVIINCTTLMSWWVRQTLPPEVYKRLSFAGSGPWIPMHMTLTRKLMRAIREANLKSHTVNTCFPDGVNPALGKIGLAPTVGGGNSDLLIPRLQKAIQKELHIPPHNISISLIAHHFHVISLVRDESMGGAPYFLRVMLGDRDITGELDLNKLLSQSVKGFPSGNSAHPYVASSFVKNALFLASDAGRITHAPGPSGLVGGWPVRLSAKGAEVILPQGVEMKQAIQMVEEAQKFDGIEEIKKDGTVVVTDKAYSIMKELIGYDCKEFSPDACEERARELTLRFKEVKGAF